MSHYDKKTDRNQAAIVNALREAGYPLKVPYFLISRVDIRENENVV